MTIPNKHEFHYKIKNSFQSTVLLLLLLIILLLFNTTATEKKRKLGGGNPEAVVGSYVFFSWKLWPETFLWRNQKSNSSLKTRHLRHVWTCERWRKSGGTLKSGMRCVVYAGKRTLLLEKWHVLTFHIWKIKCKIVASMISVWKLLENQSFWRRKKILGTW